MTTLLQYNVPLSFLLLFLQLHFHGILCDDKYALLSFKSQVTDPEDSLSSWNSSSSICSWHGVSCSKNINRVHSLRLTKLGLSGNLPSSLINLTSLQSLDLSFNAFQGHLPLELSNLSLLNEIALTANNLSGPIPPEFGNITSLNILSLARNHLSGEIPSELGNLHNLSQLQLSENYFSGDFPISIFKISSLTFLSVTQNNLSGELPQHIGHSLPNLRGLYLANNTFRGGIPVSISNASQLEGIDLSHNEFHGHLPLFRNMSNLAILHLGDNHLSSTTSINSEFFDSLRNSPKLKILMINSNQLAGELPKSITNLSTNLEDFCASNNLFSGSIPLGLGKFQNLVSLSLEGNNFTWEIPGDLGSLNKLVKLGLHKNQLSGEIPDMFGNFTQLSILALHNNKLFGRIPSSIVQCQRLNYLNLQMNNVYGTLPEGIFRLHGLTILSFAGNTLHGSLPSEVSSMHQLMFLDLSDNLMTGNIPQEIGGCAELLMLQLSRNNFSGTIPSSLGNLASLETLDLSSNNLTGPIPSTLEKLQYMVDFNLSFNHLEGEVPDKGVFTNLTQATLQGNSKLCSPEKEVSERLRIMVCVKGKRNTRFLLPLILAVAGASILCVFILCLVWMKCFGKKNYKTSSSISPLKGVPQRISFSDIRTATNNFASENLIGNGGFGFVYKGAFSINQREIFLAVKVLDLKLSKASQSFVAECEALKNVRHRNLVKLITSCSSIDNKGDEFKALVMQFMTNGNLDTWLYPVDEESGPTLTFLQRLNIAIDIANAMDYLHFECDPPVVHCDLKPGNVLLDETMVAHIGDFGLARLLSQDLLESVTLGLKGTVGYIPPEYGQGGRASTSGDVYSFGILLLEVFIGKKPTDEMFKDGLSLEKFVSAMDENQTLKVADPQIFNDFEWSKQRSSIGGFRSERKQLCQRKAEECVAAVLRVGLSCAAEVPTNRLTMREALKKLQAIRQTLLAI